MSRRAADADRKWAWWPGLPFLLLLLLAACGGPLDSDNSRNDDSPFSNASNPDDDDDDDDDEKAACVPCDMQVRITTIDDFEPLVICETVTGAFLVQMTGSSVNTIPDLPCLTSIGSTLVIQGAVSLQNLDGFSQLTQIGAMILEGNESLVDIDGLANLEQTDGALHVSDNDSLLNLDGLAGLSSVRTALMINDNEVLSNIDGLRNLESLSGNLFIFENANLCQDHAEEVADSIPVSGVRGVSDNLGDCP